mgnify:CR=1 FL=1
MNIEVGLYSSLKRYLPESAQQPRHVIDVAEGTTVAELLQQLRVPAGEVMLIFVDGVHADGGTVLQDGNRVGVFPAVGGG